MKHNLAPGLLALSLLAPALPAATVTVNDAGDSTNSCATTGTGTCTLRDALTLANANAGSTIAFSIPGAGVHTIAPDTPYPSVSAAVTIDGYTQAGSSPNSNGPGLGDNSVHLIEIDGTHAGAGVLTATLAFGAGSNGSVVRGLVVNRSGTAIQVAYSTTDTCLIEGNFLGTDPTGTMVVANGMDILIDVGAKHVTVGGTAPAARNLISGASGGIGIGSSFNNGGSGHVIQGNFIGTNAAGTGALGNGVGIGLQSGVTGTTIGGNTSAARNVISGNQVGVGVSAGLGDPTVTGNFVVGNYIGVDVTGIAPLGNTSIGVGLSGLANTIGGAGPGEGNVISANQATGIQIIGGSGSTIQGNFVGTDASGTLALGNLGYGIYVGASDVVVGGIAPGEANVVAFNGTGNAPRSGVAVVNGSQNAIRGNSIHDNSGVGIDLGDDGITANDAGDGDTIANGRQNFPLLKTIVHGAGTEVTGVLHSSPGTSFDLDFYANASCSNFPREFLEGAIYLGTSPVATDGSGDATFDVMLPATDAGARISATATAPNGDTSEFSQRLPFSIDIQSGPSAGGTSVTISGTDFAAGATVSVGGVAASGVDVASDTSITATVPPLAAGSANDLVVTNTDGTHGDLLKAFVADFLDVPSGQQFHSFVTALVSNSITAGVGGGLFGVADFTLRQQMAVFLLKAKLGLCYVPPQCAGDFPDVPCPSTFANWIEDLADRGITGGCGGGNYCPQNPVRRDQMAVFLLKAKYGSSYTPPPCVGTFPDVPCSSPFAPWIEELAAANITGGCGGGNYCPSNNNTRGQMAVFIVKTFNLP